MQPLSREQTGSSVQDNRSRHSWLLVDLPATYCKSHLTAAEILVKGEGGMQLWNEGLRSCLTKTLDELPNGEIPLSDGGILVAYLTRASTSQLYCSHGL